VRIGFSARGLSVPSGGVRQFITSIVPALARNRGRDELIVFYNNRKYSGLAPDCREIVIQGRNRLWWDFVLFPRQLRKNRIEAAIFPKNVIPFFTGAANFVVIHDLAYFDRKLGEYPLLDTIYMRSLIPQSMRRAKGVFAVSEHTKKDIIHYTGCGEEKITVTYEAADEIYQPIADNDFLRNVSRKYELPKQFILYVGSLSPRKNTPTLLRSFARVKDRIAHSLVITASKSWKDKNVYDLINHLGLQSRLVKLGYVEADDMPALYNMASVYIYPSVYEGFGLPVLEAMQCGCPVIASNATSIPEVAGDAAMLVEPMDVQAWADGIYQVIMNRRLREEMIKKGFARAKQFSWDKCAERILETIRNYQQ
jgi:glycosyltransferase involved in cell wall biosynthesis